MTDEGWRYVKVSDFPAEWRKSEHMPLIQLHLLTNRSLPLISHFHRFRRAAESDSFPSGEAKGCMIYAFTIQRTTLSHNVRADSIRPYRGRVQF